MAGCTLVGGSVAAGCGGDDSTPASPLDGGSDSTAGDSGATDSGKDSNVGDSNTGDTAKPDAGSHGKMILVHASPDAPALRFCYGLGVAADGSDLQIAPKTPSPDNPHGGLPYPGFPPGAGGANADVIDLANLAFTGFIIPAQSIANERDGGNGDGGKEDTCDTLIGATGGGGTLPLGTYFKLPTVPAGSIPHDTTSVLAVTGCLPSAADSQANPARCGTDYTAAGNLKAQLFRLDRVVADATKVGAQVVHLASAWDGYLGAQTGGAVTQVVTILQPDGGPIAPVVGPPGVTFGKMTPDAAAPLPAAAFNPANLLAVSTVQADGGVAFTLPLPLAVVARLSNEDVGATGQFADGGLYFSAGQNYAFILLGDPTAQQLVLSDGGANPQYVGQGLHVIAFPTDPPLPDTL